MIAIVQKCPEHLSEAYDSLYESTIRRCSMNFPLYPLMIPRNFWLNLPLSFLTINMFLNQPMKWQYLDSKNH